MYSESCLKVDTWLSVNSIKAGELVWHVRRDKDLQKESDSPVVGWRTEYPEEGIDLAQDDSMVDTFLSSK